MNGSSNGGRRRAARRLLVGTVIGAGVVMATSQSVSAATTATFANGVLTVTGDSAANNIEISRDAAGTILVNGGAVVVVGGSPTVANTTLIQVFGLGSDDEITLNEVNGALPRANLFGGTGNDSVTGGAGGDQLFGQVGNDTLVGRGGFDFLFGGSQNDTLTGGDADDQAFGESGDDRMVWNPGDDTDLNEGGGGADTVEVNGGNGPEVFATTANGARVRFDRLDPAPFAIDIGTSENLVLNANGGDDSFSATGNLAALIAITADGGAGNDTILGGNGVDLLLGGEGNDFVDGQQGDDVAFLGAGDDSFQWDPGDGNDTVEGQDGTDAMEFNASGAAEIIEASANGQRLRFTRNIGNIVMDTDDVELVDLNALGGSDTITVNDLSGTDVVAFDADLAGTLGGSAGDGQPDTLTVNGTNSDDIIDVLGSGTSASVVGLAAQVDVANSDGAADSLVINTLGGDDSVSASTLPAGVITLTVDGGAGDDSLLGSQGTDVILGGDGNDSMFGDNGNDQSLMGAGDDVFQWDPGDGNDTLEGQDGTDTMLFFGSDASENIDIVANGGRVLFLRDVANVTMDLDDVESIDFRALGGADNIVDGDLSGTDMAQVGLDLNGPAGGGDAQADTVTVNGTNGDDVLGASGGAGGIDVFGLQASVSILSPEQANDRLTLNALGGADTPDATALEADGIQLTMNGGLGADRFLGSQGNDLINGGDGDDVALMGGGDDTFVWNPGDDNDTLEGQAGNDTMAFNGSNANEIMDITAVGERVRFFRDVASVTMDLNDVEAIVTAAFGGIDNLVVNDLSGTDGVSVAADLAAVGGGDDLAADNVVVNGTNGDDVAVVTGAGPNAQVTGLPALTSVSGAVAGSDRVTVNALAGDDVGDASGLSADSALLTLDGGADDDVLIGGDGDDVLLGGPGDDVLIGGPGNDTIDGGDGDNIVIETFGADTVTSATSAGKEWLASHARTVHGKTVLDIGSKPRTLPHADLSQLIQDATSS